jgi:polyribonucleotide nucleotidyltransferase
MLRDGSWVAFPSFEELEEEAVFNMVISGRVEDDGEVAILMIEAEATRDAWVKIDMGAPAPTEEVVGQAIEDVKPIIARLCEAQQAFVDEVGIRDAGEYPLFLDYTDEVFDAVARGRREDRVDLPAGRPRQGGPRRRPRDAEAGHRRPAPRAGRR